MNHIINPNANPNANPSQQSALFIIRNEIAVYHQTHVQQLAIRLSVAEFNLYSAQLGLDILVNNPKAKAVKLITELAAKRNEDWRIMNLPTEKMCKDADGNPRAFAAVDERDGECEVHVISENDDVGAIVKGKRYIGKDKGEALRLLAKDLDGVDA